MSGKTAGQLAYEAFKAWRAERDPMMLVADWTHPMVEAAHGGWEAVGRAVETGQLRLAREDRDQLRKRVLDLAVRLEDDAATDTRIAETHPNGTSSLLLEERAEAKRHAADQLRHAAEPPS